MRGPRTGIPGEGDATHRRSRQSYAAGPPIVAHRTLQEAACGTSPRNASELKLQPGYYTDLSEPVRSSIGFQVR